MIELQKFEKERKISNKNFGYSFAVLFLGTFIFLCLFDLILFFLLIVSIIFFLITFFFPSFLKYPNKFWMIFGKIISKITNPIIFCFLYFTIFSIIGLLLKVIYKDYFNYKINFNKKTYWKDTHLEKQSINNQY